MEKTYAAAGTFRFVDLWRWARADASDDSGQQPCAEAWTGDLVLRFLRRRKFDLLLIQEFLGHGLRALQACHGGDEALAGTRTAVTLHSCRQSIYQGMRRQPAHHEDLRRFPRTRIGAPGRRRRSAIAAHGPLGLGPLEVRQCHRGAVLLRPGNRAPGRAGGASRSVQAARVLRPSRNPQGPAPVLPRAGRTRDGARNRLPTSRSWARGRQSRPSECGLHPHHPGRHRQPQCAHHRQPRLTRGIKGLAEAAEGHDRCRAEPRRQPAVPR